MRPVLLRILRSIIWNPIFACLFRRQIVSILGRHTRILLTDSVIGIFDTVAVMSIRIRIIHRIVPAVRVQVQPVSAVSILLGKTPDHRVVIPGPQVILLADGGVLLAVELKAVLYGFLAERQAPPCVIFVAVKDILLQSYHHFLAAEDELYQSSGQQAQSGSLLLLSFTYSSLYTFILLCRHVYRWFFYWVF